jgi:hypothetical protein
MTSTSFTKVLIAVLALAALMAPAAQADPPQLRVTDDPRYVPDAVDRWLANHPPQLGPVRDGADGYQPTASLTPAIVATERAERFSWRSLGVGLAAGLGIALIGAAFLALRGRSRERLAPG